MRNSLCFLVLFPINYQMTSDLAVAGPPRAKADFGVEIASDESDRELAALRNFPYGSINVLALGTHEGE